MNNFWTDVWVTAIVVIAFVFLTGLIFFLATFKSNKARKKAFADLHQNLAPGQYVEFANGLLGTTEKVGLETVDIRVKSGAVITVSRYTISRIIEK